MKILLLLVGLFLGVWGFSVVIQGALGVALLVSGAVFFSAACLGFWLDEHARRTAEAAESTRKVLLEIRDRLPEPAAKPTPFVDVEKATDAMLAARNIGRPRE